MGVIQHDFVLVVGQDLKALRDWIDKLSPPEKEVFHYDTTTHNPVDIVIMKPDGCKEGWASSDIYDRLRTIFMNKLKRCKWVHVSFGELGLEVKSNVQKAV